VFGDGHDRVAFGLNNLALLLQDRGELAGAESLWRELLERARKKSRPGGVAAALASLGPNLLQQHKFDQSELVLRECLTLREELLPDEHPEAWLRYNTMSILGEALVGQGIEGSADQEGNRDAAIAKFREAEPLLIDGYDKMQPPPGPITGQRKRQALERIAKLYEAWDAAEPGTGKAERAAYYCTLLSATESVPPAVRP